MLAGDGSAAQVRQTLDIFLKNLGLLGASEPQGDLLERFEAVITAASREQGAIDVGELDCRPCGRHGDRRCPQGHHRCMRDLEALAVTDTIARGCLTATPGGRPPVQLE